MKSTLKWVIIVSFGFLTGCATAPMTTLKNNTKLPAGTKFEVGEVKLSKVKEEAKKEGEKETKEETKRYDFLIEKVFSDALVVTLRNMELLSRPQDLNQKVILDTEISSYSVWGDAVSLSADIIIKDQKNNIIGSTKFNASEGGHMNSMVQQQAGALPALIAIFIADKVKESNVNRSREADEANKYFPMFTSRLACDLESLIDSSVLREGCKTPNACGEDGSRCSGYKEPYILKTKGVDSAKDSTNTEIK